MSNWPTETREERVAREVKKTMKLCEPTLMKIRTAVHEAVEADRRRVAERVREAAARSVDCMCEIDAGGKLRCVAEIRGGPCLRYHAQAIRHIDLDKLLEEE